jgi:antitoxin ParD1/3/4
MPTIRKTITVTDKQDAWITAQVEAGDFTNDSEYIRDLLRRDQEQKSRFDTLKRAIQDGLDSGVSDETLLDVWKDAEARHHAKRG